MPRTASHDELLDNRFVSSRPLGISFDTLNADILIVLDSDEGIFELNLKNGEKKLLISSNTIIGAKVSFCQSIKLEDLS